MSLKQKIKNFPIEKYLEDHGFRFEKKDRYFLFEECIACGRKDKLLLNIEDKFFKCLSIHCDIHGGLPDFIARCDNIPVHEAFKLLLHNKTFTPEKPIQGLLKKIHSREGIDEVVQREVEKIKLPKHFRRIHLEDGSDVSEYLLGRLYTQEIVDYAALRYSEASKRVIFPIFDHLTRLIGWQARDITGKADPKIETRPSGLKKTFVLYGYDLLKEADFVTLVEGPVDQNKSYQMNSVAVLGGSIHENQIRILASNPNLKTVYLAFDPENKIGTAKAIAKLSLLYDIKIVENFFGHEDIGQMTLEEANKAIQNASNAKDYINKLETKCLLK